jgi:hypothetical protein
MSYNSVMVCCEGCSVSSSIGQDAALPCRAQNPPRSRCAAFRSAGRWNEITLSLTSMWPLLVSSGSVCRCV